MAKKRDFSSIGESILNKKDKPSSLSEMIGIDNNTEARSTIDAPMHEIKKEPLFKKNLDPIMRECISISKSDVDLVNELSIRCAAEGQKTTKADVYRASIRYFSKLSPSVMASKIREVRKDKKTHN